MDAHLGRQVREQRDRYTELISALMRNNLLTSVERARWPQSVEIVVRDDRVNRSQPLPPVN